MLLEFVVEESAEDTELSARSVDETDDTVALRALVATRLSSVLVLVLARRQKRTDY